MSGTTDVGASLSTRPLSVRLRELTHDSHVRVEAALDLLNDALTPSKYAALLERWYGFETTWERHATATLGDALGDYLRPRRKLPLLVDDLAACGRTAGTVSALPVVPDDALPFGDRSAALGILYVVEGSTLGGKHIAKFVQPRLGLTPDHGVAYFSSYGDAVGLRWRETKALLDSPPFGVDEAKTIAGAIATFDYLSTWLVSAI